MGPNYLSVDLGGTSLRMALMNEAADILHLEVLSSEKVREPDALVSQISHLASKVIASHDPIKISGMALGIPGLVDGERGIVFSSPHFPKWKGIPLKEELASQVPFPIVMDNDANQAALGEAWKGAGRPWADFILITLGTGIGGGIILNHKIHHGPHGFAGEVGHIVIDRHGPDGVLGSGGTLESLASQSGLQLQIREKKKGGRLSEALAKLDPESASLPEELFHLAKAGDPEALGMWRGFGEALGCGIASLSHTLGIFKIILAGGLIGAWDLFIDACLSEARRRSYPHTAPSLEIVPAQLGDRAGLVGGVRALQLFLNK